MSSLSKPLTFGLDAKTKEFFFDRPRIKNMTDEATMKGLSKSGAYIRKVMIRIQRRVGKKGKPSAPGEAPKFRNVNNEYVSLRNIRFIYSPENKSVVVGPVKLNQLQHAGGVIGNFATGTVPAVHQFGGRVGIREQLMPFSLAIAYRNYGKAAGDLFKKAGYHLPLSSVQRIYGANAEHMVDMTAGGIWVRVGKSKRNRIITRARIANYPRRPFVTIALEKSMPKIPQQFLGSVSG